MENVKHTYFKVRDKKEISLDGVINIEGFDSNSVTLRTPDGRFIVEGKDLKIESLSKEDGVIIISGSFGGAFYDEKKNAKGFFAKLFE